MLSLAGLAAAWIASPAALPPSKTPTPAAQAGTDQTGIDWPAWGHDPGGQRFSPLTSIDRGNVHTLKVAWTFRTGDAYQPKGSRPTAFEATPLYVDGTLYLSTPLGRILALDPVTGQQRGPTTPGSTKTPAMATSPAAASPRGNPPRESAASSSPPSTRT